MKLKVKMPYNEYAHTLSAFIRQFDLKCYEDYSDGKEVIYYAMVPGKYNRILMSFLQDYVPYSDPRSQYVVTPSIVFRGEWGQALNLDIYAFIHGFDIRYTLRNFDVEYIPAGEDCELFSDKTFNSPRVAKTFTDENLSITTSEENFMAAVLGKLE